VKHRKHSKEDEDEDEEGEMQEEASTGENDAAYKTRHIQKCTVHKRQTAVHGSVMTRGLKLL
jgi:hypothetical protein